MSFEAGTMATLEVAREIAPNGYFLTDGEQDILLHYSEIVGKIKIGERVEVFLYHDTYDRMMATMNRPLLLKGQTAKLEVVDIHPRFGIFLEMGLGRNLLLPVRELPEKKELRPVVGDHVYVTMDTDKSGRLIAKTTREDELIRLCVHAPESWKNRWVDATVYKPLQMGTFVVCDAGVLGFGVIGLIPGGERPRALRQGETVKVRVTHVRPEDGRVNLSMKAAKEISRTDDAEVILQMMKDRPDGGIPYSDKTEADIIMSRFGFSKSAFKRALGKLLKEDLIELKENWTYLKKK
ncbi:S1-like domain-containing RNA-binding protein [Paenibacillus sp. N1-5-1-14]|uniref:CvfB family protein n=1 Tax=Paenibacillus radicibacter TaxID=2972488 RepID=UPI0021594E83|nr:S1-like domain-containing RNA-binding protein [Paenibacillus radicibacter]MCR8645730.1 S1-like domain-containing RNA-binding protein [Paenibacillus radicibacter]